MTKPSLPSHILGWYLCLFEQDLINPIYCEVSLFPWEGSRNNDYFTDGQRCSSYFPWYFEITALRCRSWTYFMRHASSASPASEFLSWITSLWKKLVTVCCVSLPPWHETFLFRHVKLYPQEKGTWVVRWYQEMSRPVALRCIYQQTSLLKWLSVSPLSGITPSCENIPGYSMFVSSWFSCYEIKEYYWSRIIGWCLFYFLTVT